MHMQIVPNNPFYPLGSLKSLGRARTTAVQDFLLTETSYSAAEALFDFSLEQVRRPGSNKEYGFVAPEFL